MQLSCDFKSKGISDMAHTSDKWTAEFVNEREDVVLVCEEGFNTMNFILVIPLPSAFHQIDWKIVNLPCLKLFCSIYVQIFKNKKVQWMAINSPSDRHKDRNEAPTQELKNTVIHIY